MKSRIFAGRGTGDKCWEKLKGLVFLHSCLPLKSRTVVGKYIVHYDDGCAVDKYGGYFL